MPSNYKQILVLITGFLVTTCSSRDLVRNATNPPLDWSGATVAVLPLVRGPILSYPDAIAHDLQLELSEDMVVAFFTEKLPIVLNEQGRFGRVVPALSDKHPDLKRRSVKLANGDRVRLSMPLNSPALTSDHANVLLLIEALQVSITQEPPAADSERRLAYRVSANIDASRIPESAEASEFVIVQEAVASLYDDSADNVIAVTRVHSTTKIASRMPEFVLEASLEDFADALADNLVKRP